MKPHCDNACSGKYSDWLEVNLLPECNAKCSWCIEKKGWHPTDKASCVQISDAIIKSGKKNVILLGGEPTLYEALAILIDDLRRHDINVWLTTNGSMLDAEFVKEVLKHISGINISIHHWNLAKNAEITGIKLSMKKLMEATHVLRGMGKTVRLNCNCIQGYIDGLKEIRSYINFAKLLGVDSVRFAELKDQNDSFVNLAELFKGKYGLTNDPFANGCSINTEISGMKINFRLMCGLQTDMRPKPVSPEQVPHSVLYYDGKMYDGWQIRGEMRREKGNDMATHNIGVAKPNAPMTDDDLLDLLRAVKRGEVSVLKAANDIKAYQEAEIAKAEAKADQIIALAKAQASVGTDHCHY